MTGDEYPKEIGEIYNSVEKADKDRIADKVTDWLKLSLQYRIDDLGEYRKFVDTCYMISEGSPKVLRDKEILEPLIEIASANELDGNRVWRFEDQKKAFKASSEALNYYGRDSFDFLQKKFLNALFENPTAIEDIEWPRDFEKDNIKSIDLKKFYNSSERDLEDIQYILKYFLDNEEFFKTFEESIEKLADERPDLFNEEALKRLMRNMTNVRPETAKKASRILKKIIEEKGEECFSRHYETLWASIDIRDSNKDEIIGVNVPGEVEGIRREYSEEDYYKTVEDTAVGNILDILNFPFKHDYGDKYQYSTYYGGRMDQISYRGDPDGKVERIYTNYLENIERSNNYYGEDMAILFSHFHHTDSNVETWTIIEDLESPDPNSSIIDFAESLERPLRYYLVNYIEKDEDSERLGKLFSIMEQIVEHQDKSDKIVDEKREELLDIWESGSNYILINELSQFLLTLSEFSDEALLENNTEEIVNENKLVKETVERIDEKKFEEIKRIIENADLGPMRKVNTSLPILLKIKLEQENGSKIAQAIDERYIESNIKNGEDLDREQKMKRRAYFSMLPVLAEKSGDPEYIDLARTYLKDEDKFVKVKCLEAISKSGYASKEDIEPLIDDENPEVRKMANRASRKISEQPEKALEKLKGAENVEIKSDGDIILGGSKSKTDKSTEVKDSVLNRSKVGEEE